MTHDELLKTRIRKIGGGSTPGKCVLYVMSRDQRVKDNHALLAAQKHALAKKLPLAVVFCLFPNAKGRAREHYEYMLAGLREVEVDLAKLDIPFLMVVGDPLQKLQAVLHHTLPDAVYFDFNPLRGPKSLQQKLSDESTCSMYVVDTHNIVPAWVVSDKKEVGAYTVRPKLHKSIALYMHEPDALLVHPYAWPGRVQSMHELATHIDEVLTALPKNNTRIQFLSGEHAANEHLKAFISEKLGVYGMQRNDPTLDAQSHLSPYLHFGYISSLRVALELQYILQKENADLHIMQSPKMPKPEDTTVPEHYGAHALLEELIVRKELADNYCMYEDRYDLLTAAPMWAQTSLDKHRNDPRQYVYTYEDLEQSKTHDIAWNAAQKQLTTTGKMHGYMRMYWAKKVLEWTESPEQAIEFLVRLNDFYSIDGGDPNGYAGILWSVGGVHDRPWQERDIFGVVRYMNYEGLKRKFNIEDYTHQY